MKSRFVRLLTTVLSVAALSLCAIPSAFAGDDCCGPHDSSCCPGNLITGGIMGIAVEVAEDVAAENEKPAADNPEQALGKLLYELMKKLGYGSSGGDAQESNSSTGDKPKFSSWKIEAIHHHLNALKPGGKVTGEGFELVMKEVKEAPFTRTFVYKRNGKKLLVTYKTAKSGVSLTWKKK